MSRLVPYNLCGKLAIVATLIMMLLLYPYVFNNIFQVASEATICVATAVFFIALWFFVSRNKVLDKWVVACMVIQVLVWFLYFIGFADRTYFSRIFLICLTYLICQVLYSCKSLENFVKINNYLISIQAVLGGVAFVLIYFGLLRSVFLFPNVDHRLNTCFLLTCSNSVMGRIIRPSGYFDEPGALAFWGMFALVFNKLFFNNRKVEVALLISLLFTLSAAYFVEGFLYVVLFYVRRAKTFIISILGILLTLFVIKYFAGDNEIIANYTTERFAHGEIRTSRTELAELAWNQFEKNPIFGVGAATFEEIGYMADNQFEVLAKDGIVGFIVTYLPFLIIVFRCRNKEVLSAVMILLLDYMQRPFHVNMIHNLIVYLFMILCLSKYGSKKKSIQYA